MKKLLGFAFLSSLLLTQACNTDGSPTEKKRVKTMHIRSGGEASVLPNEASISITLECVDKNIKHSKECLITKSESLNKLILAHGIEQDDILTTSLRQSKAYKWTNYTNVFTGYKSSISTQLVIRDLNVLEELYTELLLNKNVTIGNLSYSHSNMDSLNNLAYQNALEKANTLADELLAKMDESEKEIIRIGNMNLPAVQAEYEYYEEDKEVSFASNMNARKSKIRINSGTMHAYQSLVIEYQIK